MAASKAALRKSVTVLFWSSMTFWNEENTMSRVGNSFSMSSFKRLRLSSKGSFRRNWMFRKIGQDKLHT